MTTYANFQNSFFRLTDEKDILLIFSGIWSFARSLDISSEMFVNRFLDDIQTIAEKKTVIMPSFYWDFIKTKHYNPSKSKSQQGVISERFRCTPNSWRSMHPINSYVALGRKHEDFMQLSNEGCSWSPQNTLGWFVKQNVCCITLGLPWGQAFTPIHHAEYLINVPYRYEKSFFGVSVEGDKESPTSETLFVRPLHKELRWDPAKVRELAFKKKLAKKTDIRNFILETIDCKDLVDIAMDVLSDDPYAFLANCKEIKRWVAEEKEIEIQESKNELYQ